MVARDRARGVCSVRDVRPWPCGLDSPQHSGPPGGRPRTPPATVARRRGRSPTTQANLGRWCEGSWTYAGFCSRRSVTDLPGATIFLGRRLPDASRGPPGGDVDGPPAPPAWPCSRWGMPSRDGHPPRWWSLTPPFHPCHDARLVPRTVAVCSLLRLPRIAAPGSYPASCPVESGRSSTRTPRPPHQLPSNCPVYVPGDAGHTRGPATARTMRTRVEVPVRARPHSPLRRRRRLPWW